MADQSTGGHSPQQVNLRQLEFTHTSPAELKHLVPDRSFSMRSGPLLVSMAAALLVLASCGFGVLFAYEVGSKHGLLLAVISVAFALGLEISKPFAIEAAFRSVREWQIVQALVLALVGALAVAYSLQAELTFMSMTRGDLVAERSAEHGAAQRAVDRYERAKAELATLAPSRSAHEVAAEIAAIDVLPGIVIDGQPCGGTLNGKVTKEWCPKRAALIAEQARAERRATLEAVMREAEREQKASPVVAVADPGATALATYMAALGVKTDAEKLGLWLPLIGVLALEIGAAFSVVLIRATSPPAVSSPNAGNPQSAETPATAGDAAAHKVAQTGNSRKSGPRRQKRSDRRPPDDGVGGPPKRGLAGLLEAVQSNGGAIDLSQRKLARKLGASRSTLQRAMHDLAEAGAVMLETSKSGTRLALA